MKLVCFSHLRWNFVYQRPQHLLSRSAHKFITYYIEEHIYSNEEDGYSINNTEPNLFVVTPHLCVTDERLLTIPERLEHILTTLFDIEKINSYIFWYYTPMALAFTKGLRPVLTIYDCMDELSAFKNAPSEIRDLEKKLFEKADIVFTGGYTLYESKKSSHHNIHPFPSSIDKKHFTKARILNQEPNDQKKIPHPRIGFYGVIDERFDIDLIRESADLMKDLHFVLIGPVVKIDPDILPQRDNIHYLGIKDYKELPAYLSGWDIALIPFAINESTKFISPTKTPEYLCGGKKVISTPITDVVYPYGKQGLVNIVSSAAELVTTTKQIMNESNNNSWLKKVDTFLENSSWDNTWAKMLSIINQSLEQKQNISPKKINKLYDYMIVGAGLAGAVLAERLARKSNKKILLIDKRNHIGGNTYDYYNDDGILVHKYGPHIFHTNSKDVYEYLSKFTEWRPYDHHVLASVDGQLVPIPINQNTINALYGLNLSSAEVENFLRSKAEPKKIIATSEDVVLNAVGKELYEKFFKQYTRKQWNLDPSELDASVTARVPTRTNKDNRYFTDTYQAMPLLGYTKMFEQMLNHHNIHIMLNTDFKDIIGNIPYKNLIYTGPVDEYFNYCFGKLPYRSIDFKFKTLDKEFFQEVGTINFPMNQPYTRITEFKHLTGQKHSKTSIVYEYPQDEGDPYYPIPKKENAELYNRYKQLAAVETNTFFTGRLATYKYYNMDQVVAQSLTLYKKLIQSHSVTAKDEYQLSARLAS